MYEHDDISDSSYTQPTPALSHSGAQNKQFTETHFEQFESALKRLTLSRIDACQTFNIIDAVKVIEVCDLRQ
jgi:hypothetical protein